MKNLASMMKQAQKMQEKMGEMQENLEHLTVDGQSGGGMVKVSVNGKFAMTAIKIDPACADPSDVEMLEDLVLAAFNDAKSKAEEQVKEQMAELTGGMQLPPGMKLPF